MKIESNDGQIKKLIEQLEYITNNYSSTPQTRMAVFNQTVGKIQSLVLGTFRINVQLALHQNKIDWYPIHELAGLYRSEINTDNMIHKNSYFSRYKLKRIMKINKSNHNSWIVADNVIGAVNCNQIN